MKQLDDSWGHSKGSTVHPQLATGTLKSQVESGSSSDLEGSHFPTIWIFEEVIDRYRFQWSKDPSSESRSVVSDSFNPVDDTVHGILQPEHWSG